MNPINPNDKASGEDVNNALSLISKAALVSPALRLLCEAIIKSKSKEAVNSLASLLDICIKEKEEAYQEYKRNISSLLKKKLEMSKTSK